MATQDSTLGQQIRAKFQEMNKAEDEKLRIAYEQRMSNTLDISVDAAKQLTELIKGKMVGILDQILEVDQLLLEAHDRGAWRVLGYGTWQEYMKKEFDLSRSRSYQLLDRARVRQALLAAGVEAVAPADPSKPDSPLIKLPARAAQRLKSQLADAQEDIRSLVSEGTPLSEAVQTVIEERGQKQQDEEIGEEQERQERPQKDRESRERLAWVKRAQLRDLRRAIIRLAQLQRERRPNSPAIDAFTRGQIATGTEFTIEDARMALTYLQEVVSELEKA